MKKVLLFLSCLTFFGCAAFMPVPEPIVKDSIETYDGYEKCLKTVDVKSVATVNRLSSSEIIKISVSKPSIDSLIKLVGQPVTYSQKHDTITACYGSIVARNENVLGNFNVPVDADSSWFSMYNSDNKVCLTYIENGKNLYEVQTLPFNSSDEKQSFSYAIITKQEEHWKVCPAKKTRTVTYIDSTETKLVLKEQEKAGEGAAYFLGILVLIAACILPFAFME